MWNYLRFARNLGAIRGIRLLLMLSRFVKAQRNECDAVPAMPFNDPLRRRQGAGAFSPRPKLTNKWPQNRDRDQYRRQWTFGPGLRSCLHLWRAASPRPKTLSTQECAT